MKMRYGGAVAFGERVNDGLFFVEPGALDPDQVHTPGIFVQRLFQGTHYEKRIEQRTTRDPGRR